MRAPNVFWALLCFWEVFPWGMSRILKCRHQRQEYKLCLLLTQFQVRTISYWPSFFCFDFWRKREARWPWMQVDKQGSVIYGMDWENKVGRDVYTWPIIVCLLTERFISTINHQRLWSAGNNSQRAKCFCSHIVLCVCFTWQMVKIRMPRSRVREY